MIIFLTANLLLSIHDTMASNNRIIYGEDNRQDVYAVASPLFKQLSLSTAALIEKSYLTKLNDSFMIRSKSYSQMYSLCESERFGHQPIAAYCSGTLVAPDIIATAAHCYDLVKETCQNYSWVFDYRVSKEKQPEVKVPASSVYFCKEVLHHQINRTLDHALIRLDRPVMGRSPVVMRSSSQIQIGTPLVLIGHPRGLPTKITDGGFVVRTNDFSFVSNLDAFTINSGSGVFNADTGELEGILVAGADDFEMKNGCTVSKTLPMSEGGELVEKIKFVRKLLLPE